VVALASILQATPGLKARLDVDPTARCTNRRPRECSIVALGQALIDRSNDLPDDILKMIRWSTVAAGASC
jgi:hypothetical protein